MLITSITLSDFRQFKGTQTVEFATDPNKNVTVIMGENGSGKTTFAQAFTWCLYGTTDFADPYVLCKSTLQDMTPGDLRTVKVVLKLQHRGIDYSISREQDYQLDSVGKLKKPSPTKLTIRYKDRSGQQEFVKDSIKDSKVKEILPQELSKYFFFDGERIGNMSKEIQRGKSDEFADAVKRLLGLDTYSTAMDHLKGKRAGKTTVIGSYNSQYDSSNDSKIAAYSRDIKQYTDKKERLEARNAELEKMMPDIKEKMDELWEIIEKNKDSERLADRLKVIDEKIRRNDSMIGNSTGIMVDALQKNFKTYFYKPLISKSLEILSDADKIDKGIPDIHQRTIEYLFERGVCICGTEFTEGDEHYQHLKDLIDYIPPQSLGTMINSYVNTCKHKSESPNNIYEIVEGQLQDVAERQENNSELADEKVQIESQLQKLQSIGQLQQKYQSYRDDYNKKNSEFINNTREIGGLSTNIERLETERRQLSLKNDNNRKIELYKAYAEYIYNILQADYAKEEKRIRSELVKCINDIFTTIYNGGMSLEIDEKYNIKTIVNDFNDYNIGVETSTAQSISIIFAFIAGVIKMARNNKDDEMLSTEAYPLVMDAPLSAFDKARIQTVCETLPNIAEQVIIFIKDTDGEIAEKYLSDKIGVNYRFDKQNEFETKLN